MTQNINRVLVIGGSGMLGMPVAKRIQNDGYQVRLLARSPQKMRALFGSEFEIVEGDVEDEHSLRKALQDMDAVHINLMGGPSPEDFDRIEHLGTARIARLAAETGIKRLTYLSGAPARQENFADPGSKAKYFATQAIKASGVPYTIFEATWMVEALSLFVQGKQAILPGKQAVPLRWISVEDYAERVSRSLRLAEAENRIFFLVGPEAMNKSEALQLYLDKLHPGIKVKHAPLWLMKLIAALSFNPGFKSDIEAMAFYDEIGDDFGDPSEANALFGAPQRTVTSVCEELRGNMQ